MRNPFDLAILRAVMQRRSVQLLLRLIQGGIVALVLYYISAELAQIGWQDVWQSMPTSPWFYLLFVAMYFALPIGEWLVYQILWGREMRRRFGLFLRMRVYNYALVSYAGEAFLALWAHKNLGHPGRSIVSAIKDSNVLSAFASNSFTIILLAGFFFTGQLERLTDADPDFGNYIGFSLVIGLVLLPLMLKFRGKILALPAPQAKRIFLIHLSRLVLVLLLQAGQWAVVLPEVAFNTWILLLTAQMVLTRVPFLPNTDLLFAGLGITLMGYVEGPDVIIAGMFLASGALSQLLNLAAFLITSLEHKRAPIPAPTGGKKLAAGTRT